MEFTRRSFLGAIASCAWPLSINGVANRCIKKDANHLQFKSPLCLVSGCDGSSKLGESEAGFKTGLKAIGSRFDVVRAEFIPAAPLIIVPGLSGGESATTRKIRNLAEAGCSVLIESGALFHDDPLFESHRRMLHSHFAIRAQAPVDLWTRPVSMPFSEYCLSKDSTSIRSSSSDLSSLPFVDFLWPFKTKIRDFSRAVPVFSENGEVVAVSPDGISIAVRQTLGRGSIVFLGTPVGPSMLAGDREAHRWLRAVVAFTALTSPSKPLA
jgi:hypothetical protein